METGDIGRRIRAVRKDTTRLSQEDLARRADVSLNVVARLERGVINDPHVSTLSRIAKALDVPVATLLYGEDAPKAEVPHSSKEEERRILQQWAYFVDPSNPAEAKALLAEVERVGGEEGWAADILGTALRPPIREEASSTKPSSEVSAPER